MTLVLFLGSAGAAAAQETFIPPDSGEREGRSAVRLGLFGFGAAAGVDLSDDDDLVLAHSIDAGDFFTPRLRLRPSFELGPGGPGDSYVANLDLMYRFAPDAAVAIPYLGVGLAVQGHEACSTDSNCPNLWAQFALGFELPLRESFNWMVEYRGEDALRRHRLFVGLVTRRGSR